MRISARDVGVAPNTAKSRLSFLEASQQVFLLEPYHSSAGKRLIKTPKLYFTDTGVDYGVRPIPQTRDKRRR